MGEKFARARNLAFEWFASLVSTSTSISFRFCPPEFPFLVTDEFNLAAVSRRFSPWNSVSRVPRQQVSLIHEDRLNNNLRDTDFMRRLELRERSGPCHQPSGGSGGQGWRHSFGNFVLSPLPRYINDKIRTGDMISCKLDFRVLTYPTWLGAKSLVPNRYLMWATLVGFERQVGSQLRSPKVKSSNGNSIESAIIFRTKFVTSKLKHTVVETSREFSSSVAKTRKPFKIK